MPTEEEKERRRKKREADEKRKADGSAILGTGQAKRAADALKARKRKIDDYLKDI